MIGTDLHELGRDRDSPVVTLTILVRLSRLLEVPPDGLVTTDDPHVHPTAEPEPAAAASARSPTPTCCSDWWPPTTV